MMQSLIDQEVSEFVQTNQSVVVSSTEDVNEATAVLKGIKGLIEKVKASFDPIVDKAHKAHKEAIGQRDKYLKPLQDVDKKYRAAILVYNQKLEAEQRERERKANEELAKVAEAEKQKVLDLSKAAGNEWEAAVLQEKAEEIKPITIDVQKKHIEQEGLSIAQNWKFEIVDENLIPRGYLMPDEVALGKLARGEKDKANVPGVRFYNAGSVRV